MRLYCIAGANDTTKFSASHTRFCATANQIFGILYCNMQLQTRLQTTLGARAARLTYLAGIGYTCEAWALASLRLVRAAVQNPSAIINSMPSDRKYLNLQLTFASSFAYTAALTTSWRSPSAAADAISASA